MIGPADLEGRGDAASLLSHVAAFSIVEQFVGVAEVEVAGVFVAGEGDETGFVEEGVDRRYLSETSMAQILKPQPEQEVATPELVPA